MKKPTTLIYYILFFASSLGAQISTSQNPNNHHLYINLSLESSLLYFRNKPSPLLKKGKHYKLNHMEERMGQVAIIYIHNRLVFMSGLGIVSQGYRLSNNSLINLS